MSTIDRNVAISMGKSTLFGVFANLTNVGTRLITVPIVIAHLGLDGYGIWSIIMVSAGYMRFGTAGLKSAFQKYVAEATADGDYERANRLLTTGSFAMLVLSVVGLIPVVVFAKSLAVHAGVPREFLSSTAGALTLLAVIMLLSNFAAVYEAIVMGSQRVDIVRRFNIVLSLLECIAIVACMHFGRGLLAMTMVMAASEVALIACCYIASGRLLPQIQIGWRHLSSGVAKELFRFAGSYQLVNILEILYGSILPFSILRMFGAQTAGVYAVCTRLIAAAVIIQEASVLPLLSSGALVFASKANDQLRLLLHKAFKWTLVVTLSPLAFVAAFGTTLVMAWTGQDDPLFRLAVLLLAGAALFKGISMAGLILYRSTGAALLDNVRQVLRIVVLLIAVFVGKALGFYGLLFGLAAAELLGAIFMLYALTKVVPVFKPLELIPDAAKIILAVSVALIAGGLAVSIPIPWKGSEHLMAWGHLGLAGAGCALAAWPAVALTKCLSVAEQRAIVNVFVTGRRGDLLSG